MGLSLGGLQSGSTSAAAILAASGWSSNGTTTTTTLNAFVDKASLFPIALRGIAVGTQGIALFGGNGDGATGAVGITYNNATNTLSIGLNAGTTVAAQGPITSTHAITATTTVTATNGLITGFTDDSATPGNRTVNRPRGKNAIAIGAATCVITNSFVTANSSVFCVLEFADATATTILNCIPGVGSFTLTVNANATAATKFSWFVVN